MLKAVPASSCGAARDMSVQSGRRSASSNGNGLVTVPVLSLPSSPHFDTSSFSEKLYLIKIQSLTNTKIIDGIMNLDKERGRERKCQLN